MQLIGNRLTTIVNGGVLAWKGRTSRGNHEHRFTESMKHFVQERVTEGGYCSVSEYMRELIRADQKRKVEARIDTLLLEGWIPASRFRSRRNFGKRKSVA
jgi:putative addiction module CopG family antidote